MDTHFKDGYLDEDCMNKYETNLSNSSSELIIFSANLKV
jgi:hypothetical protein